MKTIWAYGGGTQSAAIAALMVQQKIPVPSMAMIADTGREASTTWAFLEEVIQPALDKIGLHVHIIPHSFDGSGYNTVDAYSGKDKDTLVIPTFTNKNGTPGMLPKYCSNEWKTRPMQRFCRENGYKNADMLIGFSIDEMERMRVYNPNEKWQHVYPLYDLRMSRGDCIALVERMGWGTPPRSSCWMCPYRNDQEWLDLTETGEITKAIEFEGSIQGRDSNVWLHNSCEPIGSVDFTDEPDLFAKPCASGMCFT